jgi:hypothetical protein
MDVRCLRIGFGRQLMLLSCLIIDDDHKSETVEADFEVREGKLINDEIE